MNKFKATLEQHKNLKQVSLTEEGFTLSLDQQELTHIHYQHIKAIHQKNNTLIIVLKNDIVYFISTTTQDCSVLLEPSLSYQIKLWWWAFWA